MVAINEDMCDKEVKVDICAYKPEKLMFFGGFLSAVGAEKDESAWLCDCYEYMRRNTVIFVWYGDMWVWGMRMNLIRALNVYALCVKR